MALAFKVSDLNAVPEGLRSAYVQKDGAFVLDVDGVVPASEVEGLKRNRDDLKAEKQKLLGDYQALMDSNKLTDEERTALKVRVDELESQVMSKEELLAKASKKAREEADREIEKIKGQAKHFETLFTSSRITSALTKAAQEAGAFNLEQVCGLLRGDTRVEALTDDDGKPTGEYREMTRVKYMDGDKLVEKDLPTAEAVPLYLSQPTNKNLVDSKLRAGGGAFRSQNPQGGAKTITRSQFDSMAAAQRTEFVRSGGTVAD